MSHPLQRRRSGGPQTPQGKAAVGQNAFQTGAYATQLVLVGEDQAAFQNLLDQLHADFAPQGVVEAALVRDLAICT